MTHPYKSLPATAFWRTAVADVAALEMADLHTPRFAIGATDRVATLGSCFAQHIGRELRARGMRWFDGEPPLPGFPASVNEAHQYGVFSFRTGNIYTPRALAQWFRWATGKSAPDTAWRDGERWIDPYRPTVEHGGFADEAAVLAAREHTLSAIRKGLKKIDVLVFTLGQTEAWRDNETGHTFAVCPGTAGGTFDPARHKFVNFSFAEALADMVDAITILRREKPEARVLLTVSPVPMTATASGEHVLRANTRTKSVLRAVAAELVETMDGVDYFPSYEMITQPPFRAMFYDPNLRTVHRTGVDFVMTQFFAAYGSGARPRRDDPSQADVICEEVLLDAGLG